MGLLMTKGEIGSVGTSRFVHAICNIVDVIEQKVKIRKFLENRSKKNCDKGKKNEVVESMKEEEKICKISIFN